MIKAPMVKVKGACGFEIDAKVYKTGHSIKCSKRGASSQRFWQPDKQHYGLEFANCNTDIEAEARDFCRFCKVWKEELSRKIDQAVIA